MVILSSVFLSLKVVLSSKKSMRTLDQQNGVFVGSSLELLPENLEGLIVFPMAHATDDYKSTRVIRRLVFDE